MGLMWFKILLSRIFKRDFTVKRITPEQKAEVLAAIASGEAVAPQSWTSDCNPYEQITLDWFGGTHLCCDETRSYLPCSQRSYACSGHYGVCCSKC